MELKLVREELTSESSIGRLYLNGAFECFTLEDRVRPVKVKGSTAIPYGHYEVIVSFSQRFQRPLPLLLNVPNFDGIRIHVGNEPQNTEGCILVGTEKSLNRISHSQDAFDKLFIQLQAAAKKEKIFIEIAAA
jgi:hypothetical protein